MLVCVCIAGERLADKQPQLPTGLLRRNTVFIPRSVFYTEFNASIKPLHILVNQTQSWPEWSQETLRQMV